MEPLLTRVRAVESRRRPPAPRDVARACRRQPQLDLGRRLPDPGLRRTCAAVGPRRVRRVEGVHPRHSGRRPLRNNTIGCVRYQTLGELGHCVDQRLGRLNQRHPHGLGSRKSRLGRRICRRYPWKPGDPVPKRSVRNLLASRHTLK